MVGVASFDVVLQHLGLVASTTVDSQDPHLTATPIPVPSPPLSHPLLPFPAKTTLTKNSQVEVAEGRWGVGWGGECCSCPRTPAPIFSHPQCFISLASRPRIKKPIKPTICRCPLASRRLFLPRPLHTFTEKCCLKAGRVLEYVRWGAPPTPLQAEGSRF